MAEIRTWVDELMIYDADDKLSIDEAKELKSDDNAGKIAIEGVTGVKDLNDKLKKYVNLKQVSFSTHGSPGSVYFKQGSLNTHSLSALFIDPSLFQGPGRLLFMGCEVARTKAGEDFLIAAGKRFFAGKGGVVGGTTIYNLGFSSGTRLPLLGGSSSAGILPELGNLILFRLDGAGNVTAKNTVRPFGL